MHFRIAHTIRYRYSEPVFLEPHAVRMQPRSVADQVLQEFNMQVHPQPTGMSHCMDAEGNHLAHLWFDGLHEELTVAIRAHVQTLRANPFDYLLKPDSCKLPLVYEKSVDGLLGPAIVRDVSDAKDGDRVGKFAAELCKNTRGQLIPFLDRLNQSIYEDWEAIHRHEGDSWPATKTFAQRTGACRDLAVLFMDACRSQGIAARFVSGYQEGDAEQDQRELHAWAEVYVPGAGWRGYDPTHGLAVADRHVAVAASVDPAHAAPTVGSFRKTAATATLDAHVEIEVRSEPRVMQQAQQQQQEPGKR
mgnify:CR=1 FL=1